MKTCTKCHCEKDTAAFHRDSRHKDGHKTQCKACTYEYNLKWNAENPERLTEARRRHHLRRKYGLSLETYEELLEAQMERCAICLRDFDGPPHVDHCHDSGVVRGLLCKNCNIGLGHFQDDPSVCRSRL